jgi:hypothetical protein
LLLELGSDECFTVATEAAGMQASERAGEWRTRESKFSLYTFVHTRSWS